MKTSLLLLAGFSAFTVSAFAQTATPTPTPAPLVIPVPVVSTMILPIHFTLTSAETQTLLNQLLIGLGQMTTLPTLPTGTVISGLDATIFPSGPKAGQAAVTVRYSTVPTPTPAP